MARTAPDLMREGFGMLATAEARRRAGVVVRTCKDLAWRRDCVQSAHVAGRTFDRTFDVDVVALNLGFQPETGLARALGAKQRFVDVGLGHLATETNDDGRTSIDSVFAVGDGASLGGSRVAMARGRLAGLAAARDLGLRAPDEPAHAQRTARERSRSRRRCGRCSSRTRLRPGSVPDETIVCRCEEVTAGRLRRSSPTA